VGLTACAALALAVWGTSPYAGYLHHEYAPATAGGQIAAAVLFPVGWMLMCAAMMLPTAAPLLRAFDAVIAQRADKLALRACVVAGFLAVWVATGSLFRVTDLGVHAAVDASAWIAARTQWLGASALLLAGAFEVSPLKRRCLVACRTPRSFVVQHWHGRAPRGDALRIGLGYGASCVGCCWALMFVMFAVGMANLAWMLGLAAVMAFEKAAGGGVRIIPVVAAALVAAALLAGLA
jgi:predicted metal-binding membrane protein